MFKISFLTESDSLTNFKINMQFDKYVVKTEIVQSCKNIFKDY